MSQEPPKLPGLRRIVTKHDSAGKGAIDIDHPVPTTYNTVFDVHLGKIWATDEIPSKDNNLNVDGATRPINGIVRKNGAACLHTDLAPGVTVPMHRTSTVDLNILTSGELTLIMEDGTEHHLKNPGDTVVQRGTLHAWSNPGTTWTRWVTVIIDAESAIGSDGEKLVDV